MANPSKSTVLVLRASLDNLNGLTNELSRNNAKAEKKIDSAKFPLNAILRNHYWIEYPKVYESAFPAWVSRRFSSLGKAITREAADLLIAQCKPTLRDLANEAEKVVLYHKDKKEIGIDEINHLVGHTREYNIFELQKAVGERNIRKSFTILSFMLATDRQEMLVITMLTRYFTMLWKLLDESKKTSDPRQLAQAVGLTPYFMSDYLSALKNYSPLELDNAFKFLCEADLSLKSSAGDSLFIMQQMLIKIMGGN